MAKKDNADTAAENGFQGVMDADGEGFTFDMSGQEEDSGYPVLPKGVYDATMDKVEYQISKNSGNPMWKYTFLITQEEHADKNLKVFNYQVFKPDQMGRVKKTLNTLGHSNLANDKKFNPKEIADDGTLVGSNCRLRLDIRKSDEYGDSNEVKAILAAGSGGAGAGGGGFSM